MSATDVIHAYYAAFNSGDIEAFVAQVTDDVVHDINQGGREVGKDAFRAFCRKMARSYREQLTDIVVFGNADGTRGAAEFTVNGQYLATDEGLPEATGQAHVLPAGAFFEIRDGKVARITNYYNLPHWIAAVGG
ncbi:ketosteroid isomerase-related protein [Stenotrophomonas sp. SAU14A_NAIMI4_8]|uniref:ketosteroid isomerase-related protein n=1 Tax=Stenotrophomonas sp. SAU14A_NAIMI4_8 TaxID=2072409 RepID=UPI000D53FA1A|nr:ketosteroid isomerase-related protein [Stenotrophomonas sp. SAU14A_NAIMI4_8]AWH33347.1 isopropylmalate/homocitrate/citramalate synthase [Stenotrophomonas sp. SAU14A_NAIMI4_8]